MKYSSKEYARKSRFNAYKPRWKKRLESVLMFCATLAVVIINSFARHRIETPECNGVKNVPAKYKFAQRQEYCECKARDGDYYISMDALKRVRSGQGTPEDHERYDRLYKYSCEENVDRKYKLK